MGGDIQQERDHHAESTIPLQVNGKVLELISVRVSGDDEALREELLAAPPERLVPRLSRPGNSIASPLSVPGMVPHAL